MYVIAGFGVTVGFHRLLTHRSFQTYKPVEYAFAAAGSMAVQGPVIDWVADHRKHHAHADEEGDPHSPHVDFGDGWRGALRGLFHAHMGWLFVNQGLARAAQVRARPLEDRGMRLIERALLLLVLPGPALPFAVGLALDRTLAGALTRAAVGRPGADLPAAPRHLVDQLGLPLLRPPAVRHRGPVDERASGWRSRRSARPGTTTTTPSRARPGTACAGGRSTSRRC